MGVDRHGEVRAVFFDLFLGASQGCFGPVVEGVPAVAAPLREAGGVAAQIPGQGALGFFGPEVFLLGREGLPGQSGDHHDVPFQPFGGVGGEQLDRALGGFGGDGVESVLFFFGDVEPGEEGEQFVTGGGVGAGGEVFGGFDEGVEVAAGGGHGAAWV